MALLGIIAYSALIPSHLVSQAVQALTTQEAGVTAEAPCHEESGAPQKPDAPAKKHCPFCAGFAAFQLAALGGAVSVPPPHLDGSQAFQAVDHTVPRAEAPAAQSRGPPHLPSDV